MNIKDLPKNSYTVVQPLNIKKLPSNSYKVVDTPVIQTEKKEPGVLKDVFNALTQSEQNLGKDIGRGVLGGDKFQQGLVSQYENNAKKLAELAAKQKDPALKQKYLDMSKGMFEDGKKAGEDFQGRTWEQIAGDVAGVALDVGTTLSGLGAVKALKGLSTTQKVIKGAITGAKLGGAYGIAGGLQEDKDALGVLGSGATGGLLGAATGGALSLGTSLAQKGLQKLAPKIGEAENVAGRVVQGDLRDKSIAKKVLSKLDTTGVKTEQDLQGVLNKKIETLASAQNEVLAQEGNKFRTKDLKLQMKIGEKNKTYNFVKDALNQLKGFYNSVNNVIGEEEVNQLSKKLNKEGLTLKEVNDIAIQHGKTLNAFNANGELASGLSKQAAENTRSGVKDTIRQLSKLGDKSKSIDEEISRTIRVRDLVTERAEKVNTLQQKIKNRNIVQKLTYGGVKLFNILTGGAPKAAIEALGVSNVGNKIDNVIDIERSLAKDLKLINKLSGMSDEEIAKKINSLAKARNLFEGIGKVGNLVTQKLISTQNQSN